ncbi:MAG: hypothetical protein KatS3mg096_475 [Candidatus Parcubacteria bacterium]|nr:MAG: hypothetical protein KatS3mg096_475 [Candidatus Parcubacteria bacterium]
MEVRNYKIELDFDLEKNIYRGREEIRISLPGLKPDTATRIQTGWNHPDINRIILPEYEPDLSSDYPGNMPDNYPGNLSGDHRGNFLKIDAVDLKINQLKVNDQDVDFEVQKDGILIKNNFSEKDNTIFIDFEGELKEVLGGIYLSKYKDKEQEKCLITTQFEPIEARKAFPCFDDPDKKATFDLTLIFPKELKAISNTLPIKEEIVNEKKKVIFETTPKMSTYLLYIGIGDWYFVEDKYKEVIIRVAVTPKEKLEGVRFALENAKKFLNYLEEYFDSPYPLKKLDLIAVPDFAAGAMENWGAITFRENLLLVFEGITPKSTQERIAEVIAHELVHMWFGNLVTMKWWDDLWLNESFATYLAYKAVNNFYPNWRILEKYVLDEVFSALNADGLIASHPIKVEVKDPNESVEIFDEISYEKGGSVLRMIENYLGEEKFREGLRLYIKKFTYQNAKAEDLWQCLEEVSSVPVVEIMKDYIEKVGYPLVSFKKEQGRYCLRQRRFLFLEDREDYWKIPFVIEIDNKEERKILKEKEEIAPIPESNFSTFILNKNYSSFFVSDYDEEILKRNLENLEKLNEIDQVHLVHDYDMLVRKGEKNFENFLEILEKYFINNSKPFVFSEIISYLNFYYYLLNADQRRIDVDQRRLNAELRRIDTDQSRTDGNGHGKNGTDGKTSSAYSVRSASVSDLSALLEKFSLKVLDILGKEPREGEQPYETVLRQKTLFSLGILKNKEILDFSQEKFEEFLKDKEKLHPDIKQAIFNNALIANDNYLEKLLNYYHQTNLIEEQNKCLIAFGNLQNLEKLSSIFEFILSSQVRFNQTIFFFNSVSLNSNAAKFTFNWLKENWQKLEEKGGGPGKSDFVLIKILKSTIPYIGAFVEEKELEEFLNQENFKRFEKTKNVILEKAKINRKIRLQMKY